jgi:transmembrane sensor
MTVTDFPDLERAREEAALWIARLDRGLSAEERAQLRRWCNASPAHARALRQLSEVWEQLDVMKVLAEVFPDEADDAPAAATTPAGRAAQVSPRRASFRPALAASLAAALVIAGGALWLQHRAGPAGVAAVQAIAATYSAAIGEQRNYELADGSQLAVNTGSLVELLRLDDAARELRLARGEALFTVAHDVKRPFRVAVGPHTVVAVGTEFDIRLHEDGAIDVIVTDGQVRLLSGDAEQGLLARGDALRIGADGQRSVTRLDEHELAARLAWRRGMIEFRGQPLAEALAEFSRYTPARFEVTDAAAARTPIGGTVPAGDVDTLLEALSTNFRLESSRGPDGTIRITPQR